MLTNPAKYAIEKSCREKGGAGLSPRLSQGARKPRHFGLRLFSMTRVQGRESGSFLEAIVRTLLLGSPEILTSVSRLSTTQGDHQ